MKELLCLLVLALSVHCTWAAAKPLQSGGTFARASQVVVPQAGGWGAGPGLANGIVVAGVRAEVEIVDRAATTTLDVRVHNPGQQPAEGVLLLPVPGVGAGTAVHSFSFEGAAAEPSAEVLPREEARRIYDDIVRRLRDPALLEFAAFGVIRTSVFPVPARGYQRLRLSYTQLLEVDGARLDYVLPRSESLGADVPWEIHVVARSSQPISTVYSPSHELAFGRHGSHSIRVALAEHAATDPGPFLLSVLLDNEPVNATLFAYPDPEVGGGYFLLVAGLPVRAQAKDGLRREVTLVLDRSGSMAGEKLDQALAAARQVVEGLDDGESFQIIDYSSQVAAFAARPVVKTRENLLEARRYIDGLRPGGGTNIHDALLEALRPPPSEGVLPIVLFLTDGLPTVGKTSELAIREMVAAANVHARRVFAFGVGYDVNVPLLDALSDSTRARSTYVLPHEDVETRVAKVFGQLRGPVLAAPELIALDAQGAISTRTVREVLPAQLPDVYEGESLTVLGQYKDGEGLGFRLRGDYLGSQREFAFRFELDRATTRHTFVPRLWAARKIAFLVDQVRQAGADLTALAGPDPFRDPRLRELADEILRLSTKFGVLSEYTAFLAREGTELGDWSALQLTCRKELEQRAVQTRVGAPAVSQGRNFNCEKQRAQRNYNNEYWNAANERVQIAGVQQVCDRAFFKRGGRWIDTRLIRDGAAPAESGGARVVELGTAEHRALLDQLVSERRQGVLALPGEVLLEHYGKPVLVRNR